MLKKEVKFKCPYCGSYSVREDWQNSNCVLYCSDCNALAQFPITSSEEEELFYDIDYNKWVEHEWPEYTTTCVDGCCDIHLPNNDDTEDKVETGECCAPTQEWYEDKLRELTKQIHDQELIIEALLDKIKYERNR